MIDSIEDILRNLKEEDSEEERKFIELIHREGSLTDLLYQITYVGYNPGINFESGRIAALKLEFHQHCFLIETQHLIKSAIDGVVVVDAEATYNNVSHAMTSLNTRLFLKSHLYQYTEEDLDILDAKRANQSAASSFRRSTVELLISMRST